MIGLAYKAYPNTVGVYKQSGKAKALPREGPEALVPVCVALWLAACIATMPLGSPV